MHRGLLVVFLVVAGLTVDNFATSRNLSFLVLDLAPILLIALPMTLIIVTGEIDLSVASMLGLTSAVLGAMWDGGLPIETIIPVCLLLGAVLGAVNGLFVTVFGLPSLAVTIGTLALYRGLAFVVLGDAAVAEFPAQLHRAGSSAAPRACPNLVLPLLVLALLFGVVLHATPVGRSLFAMGANAEAARFTGIRVARVKFWLYVVTGVVVRAGRRAVDAALLQRPRRQRLRAGAGRGRRGAARRRVDLRRPRHAVGGAGRGRPARRRCRTRCAWPTSRPRRCRVVTGLLLIVSVLAPNVAGAIRSAADRRRRRPGPDRPADPAPNRDPRTPSLRTPVPAGCPVLLRGETHVTAPVLTRRRSRRSRSAPSSPSGSPPAAAPPATRSPPARAPAAPCHRRRPPTRTPRSRRA